MRAAKQPATGAKTALTKEDKPEQSIIAAVWPVYPAGSQHGPVYDDRGRRKQTEKVAPIGWVSVDGFSKDRPVVSDATPVPIGSQRPS